MKIVQCQKGHYYDKESSFICPYCNIGVGKISSSTSSSSSSKPNEHGFFVLVYLILIISIIIAIIMDGWKNNEEMNHQKTTEYADDMLVDGMRLEFNDYFATGDPDRNLVPIH